MMRGFMSMMKALNIKEAIQAYVDKRGPLKALLLTFIPVEVRGLFKQEVEWNCVMDLHGVDAMQGLREHPPEPFGASSFCGMQEKISAGAWNHEVAFQARDESSLLPWYPSLYLHMAPVSNPHWMPACNNAVRRGVDYSAGMQKTERGSGCSAHEIRSAECDFGWFLS